MEDLVGEGEWQIAVWQQRNRFFVPQNFGAIFLVLNLQKLKKIFVACQMVSLAAALGSGLPLGKEGPVMHMASIVATMLTKTLRYIKGTIENDARSTDLLAAACTMGVAVSYAAPIGG